VNLFSNISCVYDEDSRVFGYDPFVSDIFRRYDVSRTGM